MMSQMLGRTAVILDGGFRGAIGEIVEVIENGNSVLFAVKIDQNTTLDMTFASILIY
jgi:hypothetical protein